MLRTADLPIGLANVDDRNRGSPPRGVLELFSHVAMRQHRLVDVQPVGAQLSGDVGGIKAVAFWGNRP